MNLWSKDTILFKIIRGKKAIIDLKFKNILKYLIFYCLKKMSSRTYSIFLEEYNIHEQINKMLFFFFFVKDKSIFISFKIDKVCSSCVKF